MTFKNKNERYNYPKTGVTKKAPSLTTGLSYLLSKSSFAVFMLTIYRNHKLRRQFATDNKT
jgi:hypothetical protein